MRTTVRATAVPAVVGNYVEVHDDGQRQLRLSVAAGSDLEIRLPWVSS